MNELPVGTDKRGLPCWQPVLVTVIEEYVKNSLQIAGGLVGAVIGFVATLLIARTGRFR